MNQLADIRKMEPPLRVDWQDPDSLWTSGPTNHRLKSTGAEYATRYRWVKQHIEPGSFVLDIGCNCGQLAMNLAAELGCTGYGVDIVPDFVDYCRQQTIPGWDFVCADISRVRSIDDIGLPMAFDAVTCLEVIEHAIDVRGFIHSVNDALLPHNNSRLIVTTPHPDSIMGYRWIFMHQIGHVRMWTPWRLQQVFGLAAVVDVIHDPDGTPVQLGAVWEL